jgi:hypothetical protein
MTLIGMSVGDVGMDYEMSAGAAKLSGMDMVPAEMLISATEAKLTSGVRQ